MEGKLIAELCHQIFNGLFNRIPPEVIQWPNKALAQRRRSCGVLGWFSAYSQSHLLSMIRAFESRRA